MKNYVIGTLGVIILVFASLLYKAHQETPRSRFPTIDKGEKNAEVVLHLYVFFSKKNCRDCLEITQVLNNLPPRFPVYGIVPQEELKDEKKLREITGAMFPLKPQSAFKKHIPWYYPTIVGVSPRGEVIFVLPGVPGEKKYLKNFLESLYSKVYPVFLEEKLKKEQEVSGD